jgi:hypothetical protein
MRALWDALETADRLVLGTLDRVDQLLKRKPLMQRTQDITQHVRPPQRIITFEE